MVEMYHNGGFFMHPILGCLIIGIALSLAKLWTLSRATINTKKFLVKIKNALVEGGIESAKEVCVNTRGPIASIFHAGLLRIHKGIEYGEKAITDAGSIEMAFLEKGIIWLSTIATVAPMLGFTGTVRGMISAFDRIREMNDISPSVVAGGISEALLTTLFGLVVAIIIQIFHNFFVSQIDNLILDMQESSVDFVESLAEMEIQ